MNDSDLTTKELFDYVRSLPLDNTPALKTILSGYDLAQISAENLINKVKLQNNDLLLIDARSEKEFEESHLPFAVNFPVLNNSERHNVGLIYKRYSQSAALLLAMQYADPKIEILKHFLCDYNAPEKEVYIYCWRGGGRSGYLAKMAADAGYKPVIVTGGQKAFRKIVLNFFSEEFRPDLVEIAGLTGSGKTRLLNSVKQHLPVIDLEEAARHFSSLFGAIPYKVRDVKPVTNQSAFENNIYGQIILHNYNHPLLIESESKKVGNFNIPENLYKKMNDAPAVEVTCSFESRINRIKEDYFHDPGKGVAEMLTVMKEKQNFFVQQLSNARYSDAIEFLNGNKIDDFIELMIINYYDVRYKRKNKNPLTVINNDDPESAKEDLIDFYSSYIRRKAGI